MMPPVFRVLLGLAAVSPVVLAQPFDLAPFARPCCRTDAHSIQTTFDYGHPAGVVAHQGGGWSYGLQWAEERDFDQVVVTYRGAYDGRRVRVQYWSSAWPYNPPKGHTIEDPVEDPWQGQWLTPATVAECGSGECRYRFPALDKAENPRADRMPGITYRRAIKVRLLFPDGVRPDVTAVKVFGASRARTFEFRLRIAGSAPELEAWNGSIREVRPEAAGVIARVDGVVEGLPGSHDITLVKVRHGGRAFSFAPIDLEKGPMYVPDFGAYITRADDPTPFSESMVVRGARIRERLAVEPEQSYERASREIPPLDPLERDGGRLMLALAADASWQKFGLEWGGHVRISKRGTKAKGQELARLTWPGDEIRWRIGTGAQPSFRDRTGDSTLAQFEDSLPIGIAHWKDAGLEYDEEAFATLLEGPLDPEDAARKESTPSVLMMQFTVRGAGAGHLWIAMKPGEALEYAGGWLTANSGRDVRARVALPAGATARVETCADAPALHISFDLKGQNAARVMVAIPFMPGLAKDDRDKVARLDYDGERSRVLGYWRKVTARAMPFEVPEQRFNTFSRGLVARIRLSVTKDPKSGLYMVPAASYHYPVYANEAAFQCQLLDVAGHHDLAARYLQTLVDLQGSRKLVGSYAGDQMGVYHGARVNEEYDYTAAPYSLNHGTVLWTLAQHYFWTRDKAWFESVKSSMKRAADWVVEQRQLTRVMQADGSRVAEYGLLPGGHLEDNSDWGHWFSVNAYASVGMTDLAQILKETGDAEAARYAREAEEYRKDLRAAVERAVEDTPVQRLRDNTWAPTVPTRAHQRIRLFGPTRVAYYTRYPEHPPITFRLSATREALYGAMILLETGIYRVDEPLAHWVLDDWEDNTTMSEPWQLNVHGWVDEEYWFSRGGMVFQANLQNPVRAYLLRGEIPAAIRNLYNDFVACYYPSVNVFTEEYRRWQAPSGPFFKVPDEAKFVHRLRDLLVTEMDGDLQLARGTPRRWLEPGKKIVVDRAPTRYGEVSYTLIASADKVQGTVTLPSRNPFGAAWISVRAPATSVITGVLVDGYSSQEFDAGTGMIRLPNTGRPVQLEVILRRH